VKKYGRFTQATDDAGKMPFKFRITKARIQKYAHPFSLTQRKCKYIFVNGCKCKNINFTKTDFFYLVPK
jgi:hypothetical protein